MERRAPIIGYGSRIRAGLEYRRDDFGTQFGRGMKRRPAIVGAGIGIRTRGEQEGQNP